MLLWWEVVLCLLHVVRIVVVVMQQGRLGEERRAVGGREGWGRRRREVSVRVLNVVAHCGHPHHRVSVEEDVLMESRSVSRGCAR